MAAVAAAGVVALDAWLDAREHDPPVPLMAALDWSAHLVTAALVLRALPAATADRVAAPVVVAAIAMDADHLPIAAAMARGEELPRPWPHTFATPVALALAGRRGAALGVAVHLARDLFNGPGVAVAWPAHAREVRLPVAVEAALLAALVSAAWRRSR